MALIPPGDHASPQFPDDSDRAVPAVREAPLEPVWVALIELAHHSENPGLLLTFKLHIRKLTASAICSVCISWDDWTSSSDVTKVRPLRPQSVWLEPWGNASLSGGHPFLHMAHEYLSSFSSVVLWEVAFSISAGDTEVSYLLKQQWEQTTFKSIYQSPRSFHLKASETIINIAQRKRVCSRAFQEVKCCEQLSLQGQRGC